MKKKLYRDYEFINIIKEDDGYYHLYDNFRKEYCDKVDATMIRSKSFDTALQKTEKYIREFIIELAKDDLKRINLDRKTELHCGESFN